MNANSFSRVPLRRRLGSLAILPLLAMPLSAQSLVKDLAPGSGAQSSSLPRNFVDLGSRAVFTAGYPVAFQSSLWATDGTAAGTVLLLEAAQAANLTAAGSLAFFTAATPETGIELWVTDGTPSGTRLVRDLVPGPEYGEIRQLVGVGTRVFFSFQAQLWVSDGTAAGTGPIASVAPTPYGSAAAFGTLLLFTANGTTGSDLWRTDGTAAGTFKLASFTWDGPNALTAAGSQLFFTADDGTHGRELWVSDGTPQGTRLVRDLHPGTAGQHHRAPIVAVGSRVLLMADDGVHGHEPWVSDGTAAGTVLLGDVRVGATGSFTPDTQGYVRVAATAGGTAFFVADDGSGPGLWRTDLTTAGTALVHASIAAATGGPTFLRGVGTRLFFVAENELWTSVGTTAGTGRVTNAVRAGSTLGALGSRLLFDGTDSVNGTEPWISDGTAAGTTLLADLAAAGPGSDPRLMLPFGERLLFMARGAPTELWRSDGTANGTQVVAAGIGGNVVFAATLPGVAFFGRVNDVPPAYAHLWRTDGTAAGTLQLPLGSADELTSAARLGDKVLFGVRDPAAGSSIWESDGTAAGTKLRKSISPYTHAPRELTAFDPFVVFAVDDAVHGDELWAATEVPGRTYLARDIRAGSAGSEPRELTRLGDRTFFTADDGVHGRELWLVERPTLNVFLVADVRPGGGSSEPARLCAVGDRLYFTADDGIHGRELWVSDGTAAGTRLVADLRPGGADANPLDLVGANGVLFFTAEDGVHGREPWRSDGTAAATFLLRDVRPGTLSGALVASAMTAVGDGTLVVFAADDQVHGRELWISDGTTAGTRLLADLYPGVATSAPHGFTRVGTTLFFAATDHHGTELWSLPLQNVGGATADALGTGCAGSGGRVPVLTAMGAPALGNGGFALVLDAARPSAPAALWLGASRRDVVVGGCTLHPAAPLVVVPFSVGPAGEARLPLGIPANAALVGGELFVQAGIDDPQGAVFGLAAFSNGMGVLIGR